MLNRLRSLLFVPATTDKMKKAFNYNADAVIFDLEDSIKEDKKEGALLNLISVLKNHQKTETKIFVRLNKSRLVSEVEQLETASDVITGYMVPKVEDACSLSIFNNIEKSIIALIETPLGILNLKDIVANSSCIDALAFGAEDYCSLSNMENNEKYLLPLKVEIVKCAKAYNKLCFDTISKELAETNLLRESITESKNIGFDGKLAIHPAQVKLINEMFCENNEELALKIISEFEMSSEGVIAYKGKIYERPHIEQLKRTIGGYHNGSNANG